MLLLRRGVASEDVRVRAWSEPDARGDDLILTHSRLVRPDDRLVEGCYQAAGEVLPRQTVRQPSNRREIRR